MTAALSTLGDALHAEGELTGARRNYDEALGLNKKATCVCCGLD